MSTKNPTIAELIAAVVAVAPAMHADQARKMIRDNNIRSISKANLVAADYASKDADELIKVFGEVTVPKETTKLTETVDHTASEEPSLSVNDPALAEQPEAKKNAETYPPAAKKIAAKGSTPRKTAVAVTPGPRGFRFGEVWNNSVKAGEGVALLPANRFKLLKQAEMYSIPAGKDSDAVALAKQIAEALSTQKAEASAESASK